MLARDSIIIALACACACACLLPACGDSGAGEGTDSVDGTGTGDGDTTTGGESSGTAGTTGDGDTTTGDGDTTTGDGDTTTGGVEPECAGAEDCTVVNDCCRCAAVPAGEVPPCDVPECFAPTCEANFGVYMPEPACQLDRCTLAPLSCDLDEVFCELPEPPACEDGLVRAVVDNCYGPCVLPNMCETLPFECEASTCGPGWVCVNSQSGAFSTCAPIPPGCGDAADCECMAPYFGELCPGSCAEVGEGLLCEDGG